MPTAPIRLPDETDLSWCGWSLPVPADWRPLKIEGGWEQGAMMVGDADGPVFKILWWRPGELDFEPFRWLAERWARLRAAPDPGASVPKGFRETGHVRDLARREGVAKSVWCGHAPAAGLVVECVTTSGVAEAKRSLFHEAVLPRLAAHPREGDTPWSLFSARFVSPPGFQLDARRLTLGDIALAFRGEDGRRLVLRQFYPAGLALGRLPLARWLDEPPFPERRRLRRAQSAPWQGADGVMRRGWKRLPSPLGWCRPLYSAAGIQVDSVRDRLLMAELQSPREDDAEAVLEQAVAAMRQAPQGAAGGGEP